jgi:hypothetical protein
MLLGIYFLDVPGIVVASAVYTLAILSESIYLSIQARTAARALPATLS